MKIKCCEKELELKDSLNNGTYLFDSTITKELSALCSKCEALHSYRVYVLDKEELESVKENL